MEAFGGTIEHTDNIPHGSIFTVTMKMAPSVIQAGLPLCEKHTGNDPATPDAQIRVLVVEDNELNRKILKRILKSLGINSDAAERGTEALELVTNHHYNLILMDIQMPDMDGFEASRRIKKLPNGKDVPIVAVTACSVENEAKKREEAGICDLLLKPFNCDQIRSLLKRHLYK